MKLIEEEITEFPQEFEYKVLFRTIKLIESNSKDKSD